jgi:hypothetical protein
MSRLETLAQAVGPLSLYLLTRVLAVAATAWLAWRYIDLACRTRRCWPWRC